jgi:hypothetical protein
MALALGLPQDLPSQTLADAHLRTASWRLATRDPQGAIEDFKKGLDLARPSEDFDSPWIASLRALWLLMEPESRSALETATRERLSTEEHPGARLTAEALFSALRGDSTKFREAVDAWLLHKGWPLDGQGMPVLKAAAALETWHLSAQARELCRAALRSEAALPSLLGETGVHRALENSLILSLLLESGPARAQFLLNEWVARGAKKEELSSAGAKALGMGRVEIARLIQERAFQMEPTHIASWSQILALRSFEEGRSDVPLTWFLKAPASERSQIPQKTLSQWIFTLLSEGQFDKAHQWLDVLPKEKPPGPLAIARVKLLMETEGKKAAQQAANAIPADSPAGREIATLLREPETSPPQSPALSNLIQKHQSSTILEELHQALANQKDSELPLIVSRLLTPGTLSPSVRRGAISVLMEHSKHSEALRILEMMDRDGLADHALALAYAECLWKIGRRAEALDIASAYDRIARVDPALRVSLAAFFLSVNRPDAALRQVEACAALPTISEPCAPLRSSIAKLMIDRGRLEDAKIQIALTAQTPGALSPTVLADFYKATTNLSAVSPQENEFSLGKNDQRAFVKEMAKRHLDLGNPDMALTWLASAPELAAQDEILKLVSELREASPAALTTYWESLIDSPRHAAREAAKSALAKLQPE